MTREQEIKEMAKIKASHITSDKDMQVAFADALRRGAVWADAHPHWISVKDEMPKDGQHTATINKAGFQAVRYYKGGKWFSGYGNEYGDITHWMPLPPPPVVSKMENTGKRIMFKKKAEKQRITMKEVAAILDNPIDWEQRRFEVAKDAYIKIIGTIEKAVAENKTDRDNLDYTSMAYDAIGYANILIEQLMIEVRGGEQ